MSSIAQPEPKQKPHPHPTTTEDAEKFKAYLVSFLVALLPIIQSATGSATEMHLARLYVQASTAKSLLST
jgi:hypothetical protein